MIDTTTQLLETRQEIIKEGKDIQNPTEYGIPQLLIDFSDRLADELGDVRKIAFAHSTKEVMYDKLDSKGRKGRVKYKESSNKPLPTSYLVTDEYFITLYEQGGIIELFVIDVFNTGKGLGTKIMNHMLDVADEMNVKIKLIPIAYRASGTINFERDCARLKRFYMDFGFVPTSISPYLTYTPVKDLIGEV